MDKTLYGLAVVHFYWEQQGKDIIDAYVPLACKSIIKSHPDKVNNIYLRDMLVKDYGLSNITVGAITTIMNRMVKQGLCLSLYNVDSF